MACRTCPQSGWPPTSARVRPPDTRLDTVSADQSPLRTPGIRWPGDGHGGPLDRPVGRTSPVRGDRPADGSGPGPDSGGQAADTSSAQRPTMPLASRPRPTTRPARPGPLSRQDGNAHARLRPIPAATSIGTARRDHLRPCSMPERPQAWSPSDVRAVVSGVHDGRHDRTAFRTPHVRSIRPDTVHSTRHAMANRKRRGQGTDERHGRRSDILDPTTTRRPTGTRRAPPVGPAFAAWQPRLARRWQDCQRDRNHGSDQAATWCRSTVEAAPRRTAVLGRFRGRE
jgi:hypothetical protein